MSKQTFYFYDLETTGIDPKTARIMQFAGQRTDLDLNPIGEPDNILVRLSDDILPDPRAILVHKVTPQKAQDEGISEPEFFRYVSKEVFTPGTISAGFNTIRFDDEFMRFGFWRNFIDPYEWAYADGRSRWDIIDLARMARALRPDGIKWPVVNGKQTNRLEELAKANKLEHENAHDALSDVIATIGMARLLKEKQPKLFDHMLAMRAKSAVQNLISLDDPKPLVHTSGMLSSKFTKTSVVLPFAKHPTNPSVVLVYDLRHSPEEFSAMSEDELTSLLFAKSAELKKVKKTRLPVKGIYLNRSPAIAPLTVLDDESKQRIEIDLDEIEHNHEMLMKDKQLIEKIVNAHKGNTFPKQDNPEAALYDGFLGTSDKSIIANMGSKSLESIYAMEPSFSDARLGELWFRFKARNSFETLSDEQKAAWETFKNSQITSKLPSFNRILNSASTQYANTSDSEAQYLLEELYLYAQSLLESEY